MKHGKNILKGALIGASMLLPGISGGTMAIMLGIYDRLVSAVSGIMRDFKKNAFFLLQVAAGGAFGMLLFSRIALFAVDLFPFPMRYLFMGAVAGTVPALYKKAVSDDKTGTDDFRLIDALFVLLGFGLLFLLTLVPKGLFDIGSNMGFWSFLLLFSGGLCVSAALVLPGISVSYTLLLFGIYDRFLKALSDMDIAFLFPLGLGLVTGTFLVSRVLEKALIRFTRPAYMVISGFVLASILELFPGVPVGYMFAVCTGTFVGGFLITFMPGKSIKVQA